MRVFLIFLGLLGSCLDQWCTKYEDGRAGMVHLFEWSWDTIADECETFLGPNKFAGVQVSPPSENRIVGGQWWERYQPVSYKLETRSGNRAAFASMVRRCNTVGVRIYADVVINHMCGATAGSGYGTGGSYYNAAKEDFPAVPYSSLDFNDRRCQTTAGDIVNYADATQVRNCRLEALLDLDQGKSYVRGKIIAFLNDLLSLGVAGFRVDACKHMWPGDLEVIFGSVNDVEWGGRPFIFQEVIDQGGEPIKASQYFKIGRVTEFKYGINLHKNLNKIQYLQNFGEAWAMMPSGKAVVFLNNHDNQRGHGGGGQSITFKDAYNLKIFTAFMMAWPYGVPRIMSSYYFANRNVGPPPKQRSITADGLCGNGWVCEHRWRQIKNMAAFAAAAEGQPVNNWWTNNNNQIAFSRGNKTFLAINKAGFDMNVILQTGLPPGDYCNVNAGDFISNVCTGPCVSVGSDGRANIVIVPSDNPVIALHVNAPCNVPTGTCSGCANCNQKYDCGHPGIDKTQCESQGCLWCPVASGSGPWCVVRTTSSGSSSGSPSCTVNDFSKQDCGFFGIDRYHCESKGCCWAQSFIGGIPWCFYPA